jgi:hypothetical protein
MNKLKVGYWPLSSNLKSAGDRRRVVFWAQARGHEIITDLSQKVDVVIASEKSDFDSPAFSNPKVPVIFDLVDVFNLETPKNILYKHFLEREKFYNKRKYPYKITKVNL